MPEAHQQSSFSNMFDKPLIKDCIWRNDRKKRVEILFSFFFRETKLKVQCAMKLGMVAGRFLFNKKSAAAIENVQLLN